MEKKEMLSGDATLVIMAAGIGSRYGAGIKQLQQVGRYGEIIIDYSIHDALEAGFTKVVFIIRKDIEEIFKEVIGNRIEKICPVEYVFQDKDDLPDGFSCPSDRVKPWGTGQAVLACRAVLKEPFAVINADDYYGKEAFRQVYTFLKDHQNTQYQYCMAGFLLKNTLSDNGGVSRGVCAVDEAGYLSTVTETHGIMRDAAGVIRSESKDEIPETAFASMNMWGLTPEFINVLEEKFVDFLEQLDAGDIKKEYLLPMVIDELLQSKKATAKVLSTPDKWYGVTYAEDKDIVVDAFDEMIKAGVYAEKLWK